MNALIAGSSNILWFDCHVYDIVIYDKIFFVMHGFKLIWIKRSIKTKRIELEWVSFKYQNIIFYTGCKVIFIQWSLKIQNYTLCKYQYFLWNSMNNVSLSSDCEP